MNLTNSWHKHITSFKTNATLRIYARLSNKCNQNNAVVWYNIIINGKSITFLRIICLHVLWEVHVGDIVKNALAVLYSVAFRWRGILLVQYWSLLNWRNFRFRCGSVAVAVLWFFVFISSFFAIFKNVAHSLRPGETPITRRLTRLQTMCNGLKYRKIL